MPHILSEGQVVSADQDQRDSDVRKKVFSRPASLHRALEVQVVSTDHLKPRLSQ